MTPMNDGSSLLALRITNLRVGKLFKRASRVVEQFKRVIAGVGNCSDQFGDFLIPSTACGPEICRESLRAAKPISANRMRPTRAMWVVVASIPK